METENRDGQQGLFFLSVSGRMPALFAAPETCKGDGESYSGKAADIWALGITLYGLIYGQVFCRLTIAANDCLNNRYFNRPASNTTRLQFSWRSSAQMFDKIDRKQPKSNLKAIEIVIFTHHPNRIVSAGKSKVVRVSSQNQPDAQMVNASTANMDLKFCYLRIEEEINKEFYSNFFLPSSCTHSCAQPYLRSRASLIMPQVPFEVTSQFQLFKDIQTKEIIFPDRPKVSSELRLLLNRMLEKDVLLRITGPEVTFLATVLQALVGTFEALSTSCCKRAPQDI